MSPNYPSLAVRARRLIDDFGYGMTIRRASDNFDPVTLRNTQTTVEFEVTGVERAVTRNADNAFESGSLVEENRRQVVIAAQSVAFEPRSGDEIDFADQTWRIVGASPIRPGGVDLVYALEVVR